jgi:hypothetical protein
LFGDEFARHAHSQANSAEAIPQFRGADDVGLKIMHNFGSVQQKKLYRLLILFCLVLGSADRGGGPLGRKNWLQTDRFKEIPVPERRNTYNLSEGRVYVHRDCREHTCVTEEHFKGLCNPFVAGGKTWCNSCEQFDSLDNFVWADTKERLDNYRARLKQKAPSNYHLWIILLPVVGAFLGLIAGIVWIMTAKGDHQWIFLILFPIVGAAFFQFRVAPFAFLYLSKMKFYKYP